ncbi:MULTISPECIES: hypothetical protein [Croceibacter]|uniref:hypothetical protein n=1 Tax=Croceibacter TaxID=216431 RepID=UPI000C4E5EAE|nr:MULTISPECIES: hypothetical protein [Croceibacter]MBG26600.1 hypothetical protein [Croceibacter sp.]|tara:strand:- start:292 stop:897 length:606 start_codon:yes stop_codon:yes gene_type:complete
MNKVFKYLRFKLGLTKKLNIQDFKYLHKLKSEESSDFERWSSNESLNIHWNERTKILGDKVPYYSRVIEFGAGHNFLQDYLDDSIAYTPSDIVKRYRNTVVYDLNKKPLELKIDAFNVAIFSGVLEYVYDVNNVFKQLSNSIEYVYLSYCCSDRSNRTREANGWLSDYSYAQIVAIFNINGYTIEAEESWEDHTLFSLKKI